MSDLMVKNIKSFSISGTGIIAMIEHHEKGLLKGDILHSTKSDLSWTVISRILFEHTMDKQVRFNSESLDYMNLSFESDEKRNNSLNEILSDEAKGIFHYKLKGIGHNKKPNDCEELILKTISFI